MVTGGVLAIVPARGGSKSIPRKNLRPLSGRPLVAHSIDAALAAGTVDRVILSTDDEEIAEVGRRCGADVPFMRPVVLAGDLTPDLPVFEHALDWLETHERWRPEIVVQLRPTSPIRPPGCVDAAVTRLRDDTRLDSVRGVVPASQNPFKMWRVTEAQQLVPIVLAEGHEPYNQPRQALPVAYWQTGHVDAIRTATIREQHSMSGRCIGALLIASAYACDIDTESDWQRAEALLAGLGGAFAAVSGRGR